MRNTTPDGLGFTTRFVDDVVRPADLDVASHTLARLADMRSTFMSTLSVIMKRRSR